MAGLFLNADLVEETLLAKPEKCREWYGKNRDKVLEKKKLYRKANADKMRVYRLKYNAEHRQETASRAYVYNRSIRGKFSRLKLTAPYLDRKVTLTERQYGLLIGTNCCFYCFGELNPTGSSLDRIDTKGSYTADNVVPCCKDCNEIKGDTLSFREMIVAMKAVLQVRRGGQE